MKNVISYVLWGDDDKWWIDLTYAIVANSAIYPDFVSRFYIHESGKVSQFYPFIVSLAEKFPESVEIEIINELIVGTKLTCYRVKPIWEDDVDILLCRDLDHITNALERKSVEWFVYYVDSLIHSMRSYHLHTTPYMAGLCSFRCPKVKHRIIEVAPTFQDYLEWGSKKVKYCEDWRWGCDQAILRDFFVTCGLYKDSMDCPQFTAPLTLHNYPALLVKEDIYEKVTPLHCDLMALAFSDSIAPIFTGRPVDVLSSQIIELAEIINSDISNMIKDYYA